MTQRTSRRVIHCLATCKVCGFVADDYLIAARDAAKHVRQTGHEVNVEQGVTYTVKP